MKDTSHIEAVPYKASIQLDISTKDRDLSKATELNAKLFDKFKSTIKTENIAYENLISIDFSTNKSYNCEDRLVNKNRL